MIRLFAAIAAALTFAGAAAGYEPRPMTELLNQPGADYDPAIPLPEAVTGYEMGEIIYTPEMLHSYLRAVDAASDRVVVTEIGRSHFGRPILRATVTSPENHARLDEIQAAHLALSDPSARAEVTDDMPVVVQFTHGVHGSEPSGYDSAAPLLHHLAADRSQETRDILRSSVIHLVVVINPDGANRFAEYTNEHRARVPVADPQHREHRASFPWGRTNHYWFDLNRQWLPVTQPEAEALVNATHEWAPNVAIDLHEMGEDSTYFFSPGPLDGLHPLLSQDALQLNLAMNETVRAQLDGEGALYVSEEVFDDFYLGYGSSYPGLVGSVPYLFEQSSARGLVQETENGLARHDEKIAQQARVAMAVVRAAYANRTALLEHQRAFFRESLRMAEESGRSGYIFSSPDRERLNAFLDLLEIHRIDVRRLARPARFDGIDFAPETSFVVPARQRHHRIIEGLFETRVIEAKSEFYDVSGWTQPLAYDLDYAAIPAGLSGPSLLGEDAAGVRLSAPAPERSGYAYVLDWGSSLHAPRALYRLLDAELRAKVIPDPVTLETPSGEVAVGRGAIMVPVQGQSLEPDAIHALVREAAEADGVTVHAALSGHTRLGSDLGGFELTALERPSILLVTGERAHLNESGEVWHHLDHRMRHPVSMIEAERVPASDLSRYTHVVLVSGNYGPAAEPMAEALKPWVEAGGVLIGLRGGARFAVAHELSGARFDEADEAEDESGEATAPRPYETIDAYDAEHAISGAIFAAELDVTHPLGFGFAEGDLPVHRIGVDSFAPGDDPFALPLRYAEAPLLSGYASPRNQEALAGRGVVHAERRGSGSVILFADNPYFRAYTLGSSRVFMNAVYFGKAFREARRSGD